MKRKLASSDEEEGRPKSPKRAKYGSSVKEFDSHWAVLGGYPDYRPCAERKRNPLKQPKRRKISPKVVNLLSSLRKKRKAPVREAGQSKKKLKAEDLQKLQAELEKESKRNLEFERTLREKLKT